MTVMKRLRRAAKEILGQKQWPRSEPMRAANMDEALLAAIIQPGDMVYDVGANEGALALFMANKCGPSGKVVCFEPVWKTFERLCYNSNNTDYERAPLITLPVGLSDVDAFAEIALPEGKGALASTAQSNALKKAHNVAWADVVQCGLLKLDTFQQKTGLAVPDVMKIDVEGAELKVLTGAARLLAGPRKPILFMEMFSPWLMTFGVTPWQVLSLLHGYGYQHLFSVPGGLIAHQPTESQPTPVEFREGYNVISFVPHMHQGRREQLEAFGVGRTAKLPPMDPPPMPNV